MAHDVFISYASEDKPIADGVCASLEARNIRCWIAPRDVLPGREYGAALVEAINEASLVVLVFSSNSNDSPHVMREVERAASRGIPIVPFRIEDVAPSTSMEYYISATHWLDAVTPPMQKHLANLADTVEQLSSSLKQAALKAGGRATEAPGVDDGESTDAESGATREEGVGGRKLSPRRSLGRSPQTADATKPFQPRGRWILYAAVAGVCLIALVLALVLTRTGGSEEVTSADVTEVPPTMVSTSVAPLATTTIPSPTTTAKVSPDVFLTMSDDGREVSLEVGDRVRVDLATTVSQKLVSFEWVYEELIVRETDSGTSNVNGFITESWLELETLAAGRVTIRAAYESSGGTVRVLWVGYLEVGGS